MEWKPTNVKVAPHRNVVAGLGEGAGALADKQIVADRQAAATLGVGTGTTDGCTKDQVVSCRIAAAALVVGTFAARADGLSKAAQGS